VFVALDIQHATRMSHIVICGLSGCTIFFHITSKTVRLKKKELLNLKHILVFSTTFVRNISHSKKTWARYYQKCTLVFTSIVRYSCRISMKLEFS